MIDNITFAIGGSILVEIGDNGTLICYVQSTVIPERSVKHGIINASVGINKLKEKGVVVGGEKPAMRVIDTNLVYIYRPSEYGDKLQLAWFYKLVPVTTGRAMLAYVDAITGEVKEIV